MCVRSRVEKEELRGQRNGTNGGRVLTSRNLSSLLQDQETRLESLEPVRQTRARLLKWETGGWTVDSPLTGL